LKKNREEGKKEKKGKNRRKLKEGGSKNFILI
jgi:hypothetical protein